MDEEIDRPADPTPEAGDSAHGGAEAGGEGQALSDAGDLFDETSEPDSERAYPIADPGGVATPDALWLDDADISEWLTDEQLETPAASDQSEALDPSNSVRGLTDTEFELWLTDALETATESPGAAADIQALIDRAVRARLEGS